METSNNELQVFIHAVESAETKTYPHMKLSKHTDFLLLSEPKESMLPYSAPTSKRKFLKKS